MLVGQEIGLVRDDVNVTVLPFIIRGAIDYWIRKGSLLGEIYGETKNQEAVSDEDLVDALVKLMLK